MGTIDPAFTYSGMVSIGAAASIVCPPGKRLPVQKSYQSAVLGRYTFRVFLRFLLPGSEYMRSVTGLTRKAGPNIYWSGIDLIPASSRKSNASDRIIVYPSFVTFHDREYMYGKRR